ncbi:MAG: hydroxyquinol 1,2-dioxygenase, partial [Acidimicrobiaceae bacterium]|nr:hydroxyquinol 1,2-dioxygenase [Acidimicrobiaceae bacterium]
MKCAIRHMHEFVLEVGLTREEWFASMKALADIGHMCDEKRQEFILLSDTLGVSMLVEMINQMGAEGTTEPTVFGPFHVEGATPHQMGDSIVVDPMDADEPLTILGEVSSRGGGP